MKPSETKEDKQNSLEVRERSSLILELTQETTSEGEEPPTITAQQAPNSDGNGTNDGDRSHTRDTTTTTRKKAKKKKKATTKTKKTKRTTTQKSSEQEQVAPVSTTAQDRLDQDSQIVTRLFFSQRPEEPVVEEDVDPSNRRQNHSQLQETPQELKERSKAILDLTRSTTGDTTVNTDFGRGVSGDSMILTMTPLKSAKTKSKAKSKTKRNKEQKKQSLPAQQLDNISGNPPTPADDDGAASILTRSASGAAPSLERMNNYSAPGAIRVGDNTNNGSDGENQGHDILLRSLEEGTVDVVAEAVSRDDLIIEARNQVLDEALTASDVVHVRHGDDDGASVKSGESSQQKHWLKAYIATLFFCGCFMFLVVAAVVIIIVFGSFSGNSGVSTPTASPVEVSTAVSRMPSAAPVSQPVEATVTERPMDNTSISQPTSRAPSPAATIEPTSRAPILSNQDRLANILFPLLRSYPTGQETINRLSPSLGPQNQAFQSLANDPSVWTYSPQQLLRRFGLATFYHSAQFSGWVETENWLNYGVHECNWYGIDTERCEVNEEIYLRLDGNGLSGTLPLEVTYMGKVKGLELRGNDIRHVELEEILLGLPTLQTLSLSNNQLSGDLARLVDGACDDGSCITKFSSTSFSLQSLDLSGNQFSGSLPQSFASFGATLLSLNLERNMDVSGIIPPSYCNLSNLEYLGVGGTGIVGDLPTCFCSRPDFVESCSTCRC